MSLGLCHLAAPPQETKIATAAAPTTAAGTAAATTAAKKHQHQ